MTSEWYAMTNEWCATTDEWHATTNEWHASTNERDLQRLMKGHATTSERTCNHY